MSYRTSACVVSSVMIVAMLTMGCASSSVSEPIASSEADERREVRARRDVKQADIDPNAQKLRQTIPETKFDNIGFADVVAFLDEEYDIDIFTNWRALEGVGIDRATPVTVNVKNVPYDDVLDLILNDVGGGTIELGYVLLPNGVLHITTMEELHQKVETRVYDVSHLKPSAASTPAETTLLSAISAAIKASTTQPTVPLTWTDQLMQVIQEAIEPETWRDAGGSVGSIACFDTKLVVTSSPLVLPKVESLLQQLAEPEETKGIGD